MSIETPTSVEDLFDRLDAVMAVAQIAQQKGVADAGFQAFVASEQKGVQAQIAAALKFAPGGPAKLGKTTDGRLVEYNTDAAGADAYSVLTPIDLATIGLDGNPLPPPPVTPVPPVPAPAAGP